MSRKTDPRLILNVNIKDEELEEKIKLAVNEYLDDILESEDLNKRIHDAIDKRIAIETERYIIEGTKENNWKCSHERYHLRAAVQNAVDKVIDQRVKEKLVEGFIDKLINRT